MGGGGKTEEREGEWRRMGREREESHGGQIEEKNVKRGGKWGGKEREREEGREGTM